MGLRHEKTIVFLVAVLTVLGVYAYTTIPASIFPTMTFARIDVVANSGNLPPEQIRVAVALPLERAFQGLPAVTRVLTTDGQGNAEFVVEFDPKSSVQTDLTYVDQAVSQVRGSLPPQTDVESNIINPNSEPIVSYALTSNSMSQTLLSELATQSMVPRFYGAPGLARVTVAGGAQREFHVTLNPSALAQYGLTASGVDQALSQATTVTALGLQSEHYQRNVVVLDADIRTAGQLGRVTVPTSQKTAVPLSALGTVTLGIAPLTDQVSFDAHHAVILSFYALPGADAVKMADGIAQRASPLEAALPAGTRLIRFWDQTTLVKDSQASLRDAILLGALLAILVIYLFLRNLRMTLVAAIVIPIAMSIAIFVIGQAGETLNLMSVGGLAIAVGLIIDDAIVVIENIARIHHQNAGMPMRDVVAVAMAQIGPAMIASTTTTVVVFLPLALLSGVSGFFFRALAMTLASALVVSLLLALFVAPVLAKWLVRPQDEDVEDHGLIAGALARYEPLLRWALNHRPQMYAASVAVLVVTVLLLSHMPSDFLPKLDEGQFEIGYQLPVGTTLAATDAAATLMERIIKADPAVVAVGRWTGIDTNGYSPTPQNAGAIRVRLKAPSRRASYDAVSARLRDRLTAAVPSAQYDFHQILEDMINDVSGAPAPLEISVRGPDQAQLVRIASTLSGKVSDVPGVSDVFSGVVYTDPTIRVAPQLRQLAAIGMQPSEFGEAVSAQQQGTVAADVPGQYQMVPVRVTVDGQGNLSEQHVVTPGGVAALQTIAQVQHAGLASTVYEENGERMLRITGTITGNLSSVVSRVQAAIAAAGVPPGYSTSIGGEYQEQQQSFKEFAAVVGIAVALVFGVVLATFKSYRLPLVILTAIPLALIGVALGLFITGTPFNVSSFMGLLLLVGIVVKNGILLVDVANQRRIDGDDVVTALVVAGKMRLRPIVMTTFAAIGGLLPLALGIGPGAAMERPLAIAVIGGLSTATAFTLVVIPVLYSGIAVKRRAV